MKKIIGNKEEFAIEYKILDKELYTGYAKIWFNNNSIGTFEDLIYLKSYLFNGLEEILNSVEFDLINKENEIKKTFMYLYENLDNLDNDLNTYKYTCSFGTFCDDYLIFSYKQENHIFILWKILSKKTIFNDIDISDKQVHYFKIDENLFREKFIFYKSKILEQI